MHYWNTFFFLPKEDSKEFPQGWQGRTTRDSERTKNLVRCCVKSCGAGFVC